MPRPAALQDVIEEYVASRQSDGTKPNTIRNIRICLRGFMTSVGNIQVRNITGRHIDIYFTDAARTRAAASLNLNHAILNKFFAWCRSRGFLPRDADPLAGRSPRKVAPKDRARLAVERFPALLEAAGQRHPRDRMICALGLYLFLRASEIAPLRISDVNFDTGELRVSIYKTGGSDAPEVDYMPISSELDSELRRYLTWYTQHHGTLDPNWYLCPARKRGHLRDPRTGRLTAGASFLMTPTRQPVKIEKLVQWALADVGFPVFQEGVHTLRRSGARALFDELVAMGYDGALQRVRAMLHHSNGTMTERYLGINVERKQRDAAIKGRPLFPSLAEAQAKVVPIGRANSGGGETACV